MDINKIASSSDPALVVSTRALLCQAVKVPTLFSHFPLSPLRNRVSLRTDNKVYIWNREHGTLLDTLSGHTATINSVAWNPKNSHQLATASDDHSIRIWVPLPRGSSPSLLDTSRSRNLFSFQESEHACVMRHGTKRKTWAPEENGNGPEKNGAENGTVGNGANARDVKEKTEEIEDDGVVAMSIAHEDRKPHD